VEVARRQL